jgi:hypothetical protein
MQVPQAALTAKESPYDEPLSLEDWDPDLLPNEECFESLYDSVDQHEVVMIGSKPNARQQPHTRPGDVDRGSSLPAPSLEAASRREADLLEPTAQASQARASCDPLPQAIAAGTRESISHGFEYADDLLHSTASESGRLLGRASFGSLSSRPVILEGIH